MKKNIWIKNDTLEITKLDAGTYMLNDSQSELFIHADKIDLTSADKSTWLNFYDRESYIASVWIESKEDRLAIQKLMVL